MGVEPRNFWVKNVHLLQSKQEKNAAGESWVWKSVSMDPLSLIKYDWLDFFLDLFEEKNTTTTSIQSAGINDPW